MYTISTCARLFVEGCFSNFRLCVIIHSELLSGEYFTRQKDTFKKIKVATNWTVLALSLFYPNRKTFSLKENIFAVVFLPSSLYSPIVIKDLCVVIVICFLVHSFIHFYPLWKIVLIGHFSF